MLGYESLLKCRTYQVTQSPEKTVGNHELPSLLYIVRNGRVDVVRR